jgi:hypothetical protein
MKPPFVGCDRSRTRALFGSGISQAIPSINLEQSVPHPYSNVTLLVILLVLILIVLILIY